MSDLQNPLFDEEKEFLERKKLEYERALRGDVDHIKDQSMMVGKVAAVGAGLAGGIWLITKAFSGRKKKRNRYVEDEEQDFDSDFGQEGFEPLGFDSNDDPDDEFGSHYYTAGNGKRYKSKFHRKSAADSARVFNEQTEQQAEHGHEADDLGFGSTPVRPATDSTDTTYGSHAQDSSPFDTEDFEDDPFQDLPYDDSRRLPTSHAFDGDEQRGPARSSGSGSGARMIGSALQAFLQSDTGKVLVAQVAAVALAMVTKKVSEFFPPAKNTDLATSSGYAPAETGFAPVATPVASSVSLASPDASTHTQSI